MNSLPSLAWLAISAIGFSASLGILSVLAASVREQLDLHKLRLEAQRIRSEFLRRLQPEEPIEVDEAPPKPATKAAA